MRLGSIIIGSLITMELLGMPAMAAMPKPLAASLPERPYLVVAVPSKRMTLQQIAQIPRGRVPQRTIYSSKPELR